MPVHLHVVPSLCDLAVAADEIRRPHVAHELAAVERLLLPHAVLFGDGVIFVGEQRKRNVIFLGEARLARFVEDADAENRGFRLA